MSTNKSSAKDNRTFWNAGSMGCGELILELRTKIRELQPEEEFELIAEDSGAIEDLPAWSKMTGNTLILSSHPRYIFKRK
ncbi:MAG TPA: sulfurtransferase TusA family protein [Oligoflexia bacterium]|nr:sulfurtransferase TusA family protein [Oligoflexia bacterium]HMP47415.1 sulfurtransferase TusA family protein [Oligoflexia bacterium]